MTWKELYAEIDGGTARSVYLFHGEEEYIKRNALGHLREKLLPAGLEALNEMVLDGGADVQAVIEAAETLPMMCDRRLVVVKDWKPLLSGAVKNEGDGADRLKKWLPNAPSSAVVVFYTTGNCNGTKAAVKALKAMGAEVAFTCLGEDDMGAWFRKQEREAGVMFETNARAELLFTAGRDLTRLSGEIGKLTAYCRDSGHVTVEDVRKLVAPTPENTIFEMIDALTAGRLATAQSFLKTLLNAGEKRVRVIYMITRQARLLYWARTLGDDRQDAKAIQKALEIQSPYAARKTIELARRLPADTFAIAYRECVETDFNIKSGALREDEALDRLMLRINELFRKKR